MNTIIYSASNSFRGLVPLSEYNGTILKLTKKDKMRIAELQKEISNCILNTYETQRYKNLKKFWTEKDQNIYLNRKFEFTGRIIHLQNIIKGIKQNRLQEQINKANLSLVSV